MDCEPNWYDVTTIDDGLKEQVVQICTNSLYCSCKCDAMRKTQGYPSYDPNGEKARVLDDLRKIRNNQ